MYFKSSGWLESSPRIIYNVFLFDKRLQLSFKLHLFCERRNVYLAMPLGHIKLICQNREIQEIDFFYSSVNPQNSE